MTAGPDTLGAVSGAGICAETPTSRCGSGIDAGARRGAEQDVVSWPSIFARSDVGERSGAARDVVGEGVGNRPREMAGARKEDDDLGVFRQAVERTVGLDEEGVLMKVVEFL